MSRANPQGGEVDGAPTFPSSATTTNETVVTALMLVTMAFMVSIFIYIVNVLPQHRTLRQA